MSKSGKQAAGNRTAAGPAAEGAKCCGAQCAGGANDGTAGSTSSRPSSKRRSSPRRMQSTHSDGTLIGKGGERVGFKQKLANRVRLWNSGERRVARRETAKGPAELAADLGGLALSPDASDDNLFKSDWLKARDSLENLLGTRCDKSEIVNSKSAHFPSSEKKPLLADSPCSESQIGSSKAMNSVSRVLAWDPWDKLGRKNKKENKRRKREKTPSEGAAAPSSKDHTSGDELRNGEPSGQQEGPAAAAEDGGDEYLPQAYEYQPYHKNSKAVEFINEVMVVYITGDEVVGESTEPLKRELDQQIRNKEMRRGHYPATLFGRRRLDDDYMSAWLKK